MEKVTMQKSRGGFCILTGVHDLVTQLTVL